MIHLSGFMKPCMTPTRCSHCPIASFSWASSAWHTSWLTDWKMVGSSAWNSLSDNCWKQPSTVERSSVHDFRRASLSCKENILNLSETWISVIVSLLLRKFSSSPIHQNNVCLITCSCYMCLLILKYIYMYQYVNTWCLINILFDLSSFLLRMWWKFLEVWSKWTPLYYTKM